MWEEEYAPKLIMPNGRWANRRDVEDEFRAAHGDPYQVVLLSRDSAQAVEKLKKAEKVKGVTVESVEPPRGPGAGRRP